MLLPFYATLNVLVGFPQGRSPQQTEAALSSWKSEGMTKIHLKGYKRDLET